MYINDNVNDNFKDNVNDNVDVNVVDNVNDNDNDNAVHDNGFVCVRWGGWGWRGSCRGL